MIDLHSLPKLRDSLSYLYIERAVLERKDSALKVLQETGTTLVPAASLCVLLLGPGTSITHAAVNVLAENGCSIVWCGEDGALFYAQGNGETRRARHLLRQAELVSDPKKRLDVVLRMYAKRFGRELDPSLSLEQIRGMEGVRMRTAYAEASRRSGVPWSGRRYDRSNWGVADPINRALSAANAVLNGICHAAIVSGGYSPGLGFLHTGWLLSFVYDIADLYKVEVSIPVAFDVITQGKEHVEMRARQACRERLRDVKLLERILPDIDDLMGGFTPEDDRSDLALPVNWWQPADDVQESGGSS